MELISATTDPSVTVLRKVDKILSDFNTGNMCRLRGTGGGERGEAGEMLSIFVIHQTKCLTEVMYGKCEHVKTISSL